MDMNKSSIALIVALCLGAGAGGAFLASRGDRSPAGLDQAALPDPGAAMEQSEAVVTGESQSV